MLCDPDLQSPVKHVTATDLQMSHSSEDRIAYSKMKASIESKDGHFLSHFIVAKSESATT